MNIKRGKLPRDWCRIIPFLSLTAPRTRNCWLGVESSIMSELKSSFLRMKWHCRSFFFFSGGNICPNCKALDLPRMFSSFDFDVLGMHRGWLPKLSWSAISRGSSQGCPICRLFAVVREFRREIWYTEPLVRLQAVSPGTAGRFWPWDQNTMLFRDEPLVEITTGCYLTASQKEDRNGCIMKIESSGQSSAFKKILGNPQVDFAKIRWWMELCHERHHESCSRFGPGKPVKGMSLVDVYMRLIVPAVVDVEYAALSYVWGRGSLPTGNFLPYPAPRTIEDAIIATKNLRIPYLWIDRYCIPQDGKEKHHQISNMHHIYQNAKITIIAAAGDNPDYGLPGITVNKNFDFSHAFVDGQIFFAFRAGRDPTRLIAASKWASRGWTYQEAFFFKTKTCFHRRMRLFRVRPPDQCSGF